jgi:hypothetical protein
MKMCLLRVGIDTGSGGILGPLFKKNRFEYVPIPEEREKSSGRTYGEIRGKKTSRYLYEFFPKTRQRSVRDSIAHYDPEFDTFTYGDPTRPKRSLRYLCSGDLLVFYAGLEPFGFVDDTKRGLYIIGYFEVESAGEAENYTGTEVRNLFGSNFHIKYMRREKRLILVKGSKKKSRLLNGAQLISKLRPDRAGHETYVLSDLAESHLGKFTRLNAIQRSMPRWVSPQKTKAAAKWIRNLP